MLLVLLEACALRVTELDCPDEEVLEESLEVTQWSTRTEKRTSALQHMRQTHAGSPLRTMSIVRLLNSISKTDRGKGKGMDAHDTGSQRSQSTEEGPQGDGAESRVW
jgi:hypothetical protein